MCIGGSPSMPAVPPPPPPAPPLPKQTDPAVRAARDTNRQRAALANGREKTIVTSSQGLTSEATTTGKKTLLGN